jgi:hypothetical protein
LVGEQSVPVKPFFSPSANQAAMDYRIACPIMLTRTKNFFLVSRCSRQHLDGTSTIEARTLPRCRYASVSMHRRDVPLAARAANVTQRLSLIVEAAAD